MSPDSKNSPFNLNQVEQERLFQVRRSFQQALNKISSNDTKEVGVQECKRIIESNYDQACLRIYLSLLCEKHKNSTTSNKELQVLLFGHLAKVYKTELLDPLDKPPNLLKTVVRICENIHSFLKENSTLIHLACASSLVEILDYCFVSKEDKLSLSLIFYEPLAAVINGGYDKMGQMAASMCILKLIEYLIEKGHEQMYDFICPKFVQLFVKSKCDHPEFLNCMQAIINHSSLKYVTQYIWEIVQKCIKIVENPDTQAYLRKIEACNLLKTIAINLKDVADLIFGYMHRQVIQSLEKAHQGDRVLKVRQGALQAKQQWLTVKFINNEIEEKKKNQELQGLSADEIIQARTGYADVDEVRKQVLEEAQEDILKPRPQTANPTKSHSDNQVRPGSSKKFKMLRELARLNQELRVQKPYSPTAQEKKQVSLDQNWSAATRGQQFLKRGLGTGGGHIPGASSERVKGKLGSHILQRQSIKDLILGHLKNKNLTEKELESYIQGDAEMYDLIKKQYEEEKRQLDHNDGPEVQAIADRVANDRQKLTLRQDIGNFKQDTQTFKDGIDLSNKSEINGLGSTQGLQRQKTSQINQENGGDDFFEEEVKVSGDQSLPPGMDGEQQNYKSGKVTFKQEYSIPDYGAKGQIKDSGMNNFKRNQTRGDDQFDRDESSNTFNPFKQLSNAQEYGNANNISGKVSSPSQQSKSKTNNQIKDDASVISDLIEGALGLSNNQPPIKLSAAQEQIKQKVLQGRNIKDLSKDEVKKLSDQILKQALNEDSELTSQISNNLDRSRLSKQNTNNKQNIKPLNDDFEFEEQAFGPGDQQIRQDYDSRGGINNDYSREPNLQKQLSSKDKQQYKRNESGNQIYDRVDSMMEKIKKKNSQLFQDEPEQNSNDIYQKDSPLASSNMSPQQLQIIKKLKKDQRGNIILPKNISDLSQLAQILPNKEIAKALLSQDQLPQDSQGNLVIPQALAKTIGLDNILNKSQNPSFINQESLFLPVKTDQKGQVILDPSINPQLLKKPSVPLQDILAPTLAQDSRGNLVLNTNDGAKIPVKPDDFKVDALGNMIFKKYDEQSGKIIEGKVVNGQIIQDKDEENAVVKDNQGNFVIPHNSAESKIIENLVNNAEIPIQNQIQTDKQGNLIVPKEVAKLLGIQQNLEQKAAQPSNSNIKPKIDAKGNLIIDPALNPQLIAKPEILIQIQSQQSPLPTLTQDQKGDVILIAPSGQAIPVKQEDFKIDERGNITIQKVDPSTGKLISGQVVNGQVIPTRIAQQSTEEPDVKVDNNGNFVLSQEVQQELQLQPILENPVLMQKHGISKDLAGNLIIPPQAAQQFGIQKELLQKASQPQKQRIKKPKTDYNGKIILDNRINPQLTTKTTKPIPNAASLIQNSSGDIVLVQPDGHQQSVKQEDFKIDSQGNITIKKVDEKTGRLIEGKIIDGQIIPTKSNNQMAQVQDEEVKIDQRGNFVVSEDSEELDKIKPLLQSKELMNQLGISKDNQGNLVIPQNAANQLGLQQELTQKAKRNRKSKHQKPKIDSKGKLVLDPIVNPQLTIKPDSQNQLIPNVPKLVQDAKGDIVLVQPDGQVMPVKSEDFIVDDKGNITLQKIDDKSGKLIQGQVIDGQIIPMSLVQRDKDGIMQIKDPFNNISNNDSSQLINPFVGGQESQQNQFKPLNQNNFLNRQQDSTINPAFQQFDLDQISPGQGNQSFNNQPGFNQSPLNQFSQQNPFSKTNQTSDQLGRIPTFGQQDQQYPFTSSQSGYSPIDQQQKTYQQYQQTSQPNQFQQEVPQNQYNQNRPQSKFQEALKRDQQYQSQTNLNPQSQSDMNYDQNFNQMNRQPLYQDMNQQPHDYTKQPPLNYQQSKSRSPQRFNQYGSSQGYQTNPVHQQMGYPLNNNYHPPYLSQSEINQKYSMAYSNNPMEFNQFQNEGDIIGQLKNVEQFMLMSFENLNSRLKNINHKIGDTKYNLTRLQRSKRQSLPQNNLNSQNNLRRR